MYGSDPIGRMIAQLSGRSLDQHAVEPTPAAARMPYAAGELRGARRALTLAVDALRDLLVYDHDLDVDTNGRTTVDLHLTRLTELAGKYQDARRDLDDLIHNAQRRTYAAKTPARTVKRRYVQIGCSVVVVLPHTATCRAEHVAGSRVRLDLHDELFVDIRRPDTTNVLSLSYNDAGIYRDPVTSRLYVLDQVDDPAAPVDDTPAGDSAAAAGRADPDR